MSNTHTPNPSTTNNVYNHNEDYLHIAAGLGSKEETAERLEKVNTQLNRYDAKVTLSMMAEVLQNEFTAKELACMLAAEQADSMRRRDPLSMMMDLLSD